MLGQNVSTLDTIEAKVRDLHRAVWDNQVALWQGQKVTPLDVCDPVIAAGYLGYDYQEGSIDSAGSRAGKYSLAGFIDRPRRLIAVAADLKPHIKRFTAAHELGHLQLHPGLHHHRERPIEGLAESNAHVEPQEREANLFAGCFLIPRLQLRRAFRACFAADQLTLTDTVAFELAGREFQSLLAADPQSLAFALRVARCCHFMGRQFEPLNQLFGVSVTTMAIRLRQVGLIHSHY